MRVHYGIENIQRIRNPVVTVGCFDGVHIGHQVIVNRLNEIAEHIRGESVLITFYPHPRKVLYPNSYGRTLQFINSQKEKISLLRRSGLNHCIIVKFTIEFSRVSPELFVRNFLVSKLNAKYVVVGFNHFFGHNKQGNSNYLSDLGKELGFEVEEILEQDVHKEKVSATTIREALKQGKISRTNLYLNHPYFIIGDVGLGSPSFATIGFPTLMVQIEEASKLIPPDGIYAVSVNWGSFEYKALCIIWRENDQSAQPLDAPNVEISILNFDRNYPEEEVTIYFRSRIIQNANVTNLELLREQLNRAVMLINEKKID